MLAPTGTIAFMMDCDTTGVEPDIALIKYKKLVGEGFLKIVNQTVPAALRKLGYGAEQVDEILAYLTERETIEGAPHLKPQHLPVFDCAFKPANGERSIHYMGHVRMMGADPAVHQRRDQQDREHARSGHGRGDRDGLPRGLEARPQGDRGLPRQQQAQPAAAAPARRRTATRSSDARPPRSSRSSSKQLAQAQVEAALPHRRRLPAERSAVTHKFEIAGHEGYITVGLYPDGQPGEIFLKMAKEGSTVSGLMDTFATTVSVALQYGVPLRDLVNKFAHVRFEPSGFTGNQEIPIAKSHRGLHLPLARLALPVRRGQGDRSDSSIAPRSWTMPRPPPGLRRGSAAAAVASPRRRSPAARPSPAVAPSRRRPTESDSARRRPPSPPPPSLAPAPAKSTSSRSSRPTATPTVTRRTATARPANGNGGGGTAPITLNLGATKVSFQTQADAPSCADCGSIMVRNGPATVPTWPTRV